MNKRAVLFKRKRYTVCKWIQLSSPHLNFFFFVLFFNLEKKSTSRNVENLDNWHMLTDQLTSQPHEIKWRRGRPRPLLWHNWVRLTLK